ncbi:MAG: nucleoside-diphosphate kinase [Chitinophagales bacterium]|nr:nucleoside-diphosphate kinase [Chitinophagales bacterium]
MTTNETFTMIKPDAVTNGHTGKILDQILNAGFTIKAMKYTRLSKEQAEMFYAIHKERPFFNDLVNFMTSGSIVAAILQKENAVNDFRELIGNTDPKKAAPGTIRNKFAQSIDANAIHGSDSDENAEIEGNIFLANLKGFNNRKQ